MERSARLSDTRPRRATVRRSQSASRRWASEITRRPRAHLGRMGMRRDSSARSAGNASITSSSLANPTRADTLPTTRAITTRFERICLWARMCRPVGQCNGSVSSLSGRFSAGFIISAAECSSQYGQLAPLRVARMPLAEPPPYNSRFGSPLALSRADGPPSARHKKCVRRHGVQPTWLVAYSSICSTATNNDSMVLPWRRLRRSTSQPW